MHNSILRTLFIAVTVFFSISCNTTKRITEIKTGINSLHYLGSYEIPFNFKYNNTIVGGLSGIDYDKKNDLFYLICDDRSDKNPARYYTARIFLDAKGIDSLVFVGTQPLLQYNGKKYPGVKDDRFNTIDPESIRYNAREGYVIWSSEGERIVSRNDTVLTDPALNMNDIGGQYINKFILPANLKMQAQLKGPRRNGVFEGISFADNYRTLFVQVEEPLYEDGPKADLQDNNAFTRIIKFDVKTRKALAQYAYKLNPVAHRSIPDTAFKINGVSEILSLGNNKLLVIERSFSTGRLPCTIKIFIADLNGATDISSMTLQDDPSFTPAAKTLLLNMDDLGIYTDNIEGVSFGPVLPNGHKTLLFIADNNFSVLEKAQVLLFEVLE
jgi:hypothetical protein